MWGLHAHSQAARFSSCHQTRPASTCGVQSISRRTLVVSNVYGDLPKIGAWRAPPSRDVPLCRCYHVLLQLFGLCSLCRWRP
jgi:hypothetical protein